MVLIKLDQEADVLTADGSTRNTYDFVTVNDIYLDSCRIDNRINNKLIVD